MRAGWISTASSRSASARDRQRQNAGLAEDEETELSTQLTGNISNAELDRVIAEFRTHPLTQWELRQVKEGLYVALSQSLPEGFEYVFCLNSGGRMHFFFRKAAASAARHRFGGP
jgi:hypothetical protein